MQGQQIRNQIQTVHPPDIPNVLPIIIYISAKKMHAEPQTVGDMLAININSTATSWSTNFTVKLSPTC